MANNTSQELIIDSCEVENSFKIKEKPQMKKKSIISIVLVLSIIASLFTMSAISTSAAGKPAAPSVTIVNGGSANGLYVRWTSTGDKYEIAYREKGDNANGAGYTKLQTYSSYLTITGLSSGVCYEVQVRAYRSSQWGGWSKTRSMTFIARPSLGGKYRNSKNYIYWKAIPGANKYTVVRFDVDKDTYKTVYSGSETSFTDDYIPLGKHKYQIIAMYETENNGTAYSSWSKVTNMNWNPSEDDAKHIITDFLKGKGLNDAAVCGIIANIKAICNFSVGEYTQPISRFGGVYGGLCAWYADNFKRFERDCPDWKTSFSSQLEYLWKTLLKDGKGKETEPYYYPYCNGCLNRLLTIKNTTQGAEEAAKVFCNNYVLAADMTQFQTILSGFAKQDFDLRS